jgi:hypothetical protein
MPRACRTKVRELHADYSVLVKQLQAEVAHNAAHQVVQYLAQLQGNSPAELGLQVISVQNPDCKLEILRPASYWPQIYAAIEVGQD